MGDEPCRLARQHGSTAAAREEKMQEIRLCCISASIPPEKKSDHQVAFLRIDAGEHEWIVK
jgi:hypothetical protein